MAIHNASFLQSGSYGASDFRLPSSSLIAQNGVVGTSDMQVTAPSSGLSVNIATGQAWVQGTQSAFQGSYYVYNDATYSLPIGAANASNPRIDLIGIQIIDAAYGGGTSSTTFVDIQGVPAPTPSAPSAPANFLTLAQVTVPAGATSITSGDIADKRVQFLTSLASEVHQPIFRAWYSGSYSYPSGVSQVIFNTVIEDNYNGFNPSNSNYYVPSAGLYLVHAEWKPNGTVAGASYMWLQINSNQVNQSGNWYLSPNGYISMSSTHLIRCNVGDYLQAAINIPSAQSNVLDYFPSTFIDIVKVSN